MPPTAPATAPIDRRAFIGGLAALAAASALRFDRDALATISNRRKPMTIVCVIRYQIDPYQRDAFQQYAETWGRVIPRCGGHLVGYFLPWQGTNDIGWGLIAFESLAAYQQYQTRLREDPQGQKNFEMAQDKKFILREERNFVEVVEGTFELPSTLAPS